MDILKPGDNQTEKFWGKCTLCGAILTAHRYELYVSDTYPIRHRCAACDSKVPSVNFYPEGTLKANIWELDVLTYAAKKRLDAEITERL